MKIALLLRTRVAINRESISYISGNTKT